MGFVRNFRAGFLRPQDSGQISRSQINYLTIRRGAKLFNNPVKLLLPHNLNEYNSSNLQDAPEELIGMGWASCTKL